MPWNKGFTKLTHPSVMKTSATMRVKHIDNFKNWRDSMKAIGKIPSSYPDLIKSKELAEFIGVVLGDGNISMFPRTERLIIVGNSNNQGFLKRYKQIAWDIFKKEPSLKPINGSNATRIDMYQKHISKRLGIPCGSRHNFEFQTPVWILQNDDNLIGLLRGLFEAEGSLSIHKPTYTYNFAFSNTNLSLLKTVADGLETFGFHPEKRSNAVRLRRKSEVERFKELIGFRKYD